jgi:hypothetical protein
MNILSVLILAQRRAMAPPDGGNGLGCHQGVNQVSGTKMAVFYLTSTFSLLS